MTSVCLHVGAGGVRGHWVGDSSAVEGKGVGKEDLGAQIKSPSPSHPLPSSLCAPPPSICLSHSHQMPLWRERKDIGLLHPPAGNANEWRQAVPRSAGVPRPRGRPRAQLPGSTCPDLTRCLQAWPASWLPSQTTRACLLWCCMSREKPPP